MYSFISEKAIPPILQGRYLVFHFIYRRDYTDSTVQSPQGSAYGLTKFYAAIDPAREDQRSFAHSRYLNETGLDNPESTGEHGITYMESLGSALRIPAMREWIRPEWLKRDSVINWERQIFKNKKTGAVISDGAIRDFLMALKSDDRHAEMKLAIESFSCDISHNLNWDI